MKAKETDSSANAVLQKKIAALETELLEACEAREEANNAKTAIMAKLRQAEEAHGDVLDKVDDLQFNNEKLNKVASLFAFEQPLYFRRTPP